MSAPNLMHDEIEAFVAQVLGRQPATFSIPDHQVDFLPGGPVLVVTFEPAANKQSNPDLARPVWGQTFLQRRGHSVLGVKRTGNNWYRSVDLHRVFRALQSGGAFRSFGRAIFYGPSMGGFAALAFAAAAPGCTVLALSPPSSLVPDRVWFDQRAAGPHADAWRGDFADGVDGAASAMRVYVCFDPYQTKDRLHVDRLPAFNRVNLRMPFGGHSTAQTLQALGLLGPIFDRALAGTLDEAGFRHMARVRASSADYRCRLAERGVWTPRRLVHLNQALQLDPGHVRAKLLRDRLSDAATEPLAVPAAGSGGETSDAVPSPNGPTRQWPMGIVTARRVPLVYLNMPKCASTTVQNHLLYIATGAYATNPQAIHRHAGLIRSRDRDEPTQALIADQIEQGGIVFTFVRDPGHRAYACFNEKFMHAGPHSFVEIRNLLVRDFGMRLPAPGEPASLDLQRENFAAYLRFVEANLAGDTSVRRDPHWLPQGPMLVHYRKHLKIAHVGKVENFAADMALVLHWAGVRRVPDVQWRPWRHPAAPFSFEEVITPDLQAQLDRLYEADYIHLGYRSRSSESGGTQAASLSH